MEPNGTQWNTMEHNGKKHGHGTFTNKTGITTKGIWEEGKLIQIIEQKSTNQQ